LAAIGVAAATWVVATVARARIRRRRQEQAARVPSRPPTEIGLRGLSEADAAARWLEGQDNAILWKRPLSKREIVRVNTLTIFILCLVGLFAVQILPDKPWNALLTVVRIAGVVQRVWRSVGRSRAQGTDEQAKQPPALPAPAHDDRQDVDLAAVAGMQPMSARFGTWRNGREPARSVQGG
jgi:hypothetical protein